MEVSKRDWKLFRVKIAEWQESYMERLVKEYIELLSGTGRASEKWWELDKRIRKDRKNPGVIIELNKGDMIYDVTYMIRLGVITLDDLEDFSDEFRESVAFLLNRF